MLRPHTSPTCSAHMLRFISGLCPFLPWLHACVRFPLFTVPTSRGHRLGSRVTWDDPWSAHMLRPHAPPHMCMCMCLCLLYCIRPGVCCRRLDSSNTTHPLPGPCIEWLRNGKPKRACSAHMLRPHGMVRPWSAHAPPHVRAVSPVLWLQASVRFLLYTVPTSPRHRLGSRVA